MSATLPPLDPPTQVMVKPLILKGEAVHDVKSASHLICEDISVSHPA
jgi:hypothetical protein